MNVFALESEEALLLLEYEKSDSIAHVAKTFGRDPSVISRSLKKLSEKLPVLEKSHGKWIVTDLGKKFNHWTTEAISSQKNIMNQRSNIRIASTREFANRYLIGSINKLFSPEEFHVEIKTFESESESLLLNGLVDFVFDCGKPYDPQIAFKRPTSEEMAIIVSKSFKQHHKIKSTMDLSALSHIHYSRNNLSRLYQLTKDELNLSMTVNDIALVREAVINGLGWGLVPTYTVKEELKNKDLVEVPLSKSWKLASYQFGLWWNREKNYLKPHAEVLLNWLEHQQLN